MKNLNEMVGTIMFEILGGYYENYFSHDDLENEIEYSRYEIIIDWAKLCSEEEYNRLVEDPKVYQNIYDEAFDRAKKAVLAAIL